MITTADEEDIINIVNMGFLREIVVFAYLNCYQDTINFLINHGSIIQKSKTTVKRNITNRYAFTFL